MSFFDSRPQRPRAEKPSTANQVPITPIDLTKRYDVYASTSGEERLYEDVRFVGIRTFDRITEFSSGLSGGYLEIEARDGSRLFIPSFGIQMLCEHGTKPSFKIIRRWSNMVDY